MGVTFDCIICNGQAGENETVLGEHVCSSCQEKALRLGLMMLKGGMR